MAFHGDGMKDPNHELSFFETLPDRLEESAACLRQAGPLDFPVEKHEHRLPKEKPKLLDSGKTQST
jgi:hypothetical protein